MNPGLLNKRIILNYPVSSSIDRFGQAKTSYATSSLWASIQAISGNESKTNGIAYSTATYVFTVRQNNNVTEKATFTFNDKKYNITYVELPNRGLIKVTAERVG